MAKSSFKNIFIWNIFCFFSNLIYDAKTSEKLKLKKKKYNITKRIKIVKISKDFDEN